VSEAGAHFGQSYGNNNGYGSNNSNGYGRRQSYGYSSSSYGGLYQPKVSSQYGFVTSGQFAKHDDAAWNSARHQSWTENKPVSTRFGGNREWSHMDRPGMDRSNMDRPGMDKPGMDRSNMDRSNMDRPGMDRSNMDRPGMDRSNMDRPGMDRQNMDMSTMGRPIMPSKEKPSSNLISLPIVTTVKTQAPVSSMSATTVTTDKPTTQMTSSTTTQMTTTVSTTTPIPVPTTSVPTTTSPVISTRLAVVPLIDLNSDISDEVDLTQLARRPAVADLSGNSLEQQQQPVNIIALRSGTLESFPAVPNREVSASASRLPPTLMAVAAVPGLPILEGDALR
jgi:hypothetical protein